MLTTRSGVAALAITLVATMPATATAETNHEPAGVAKAKRCGKALGVAVTVTKGGGDVSCSRARRVVRAGFTGEGRGCGGAQQGACRATGSWRCRLGTAGEASRGRDGYCYVPRKPKALAKDLSFYRPTQWRYAISLRRPSSGAAERVELLGEREVGGLLVSGDSCPFPTPASNCTVRLRGAPADGYEPFVVPEGGGAGFAPLVPVSNGKPPERGRNDGTGRWYLQLTFRCSAPGSRTVVIYDAGDRQLDRRYRVPVTCRA